MDELKIFIWEGDGISNSYHDDGTLVVLAHTAAEARKIMLDERHEKERQAAARNQEMEAAAVAAGHVHGAGSGYYWRRADPTAMTAKLAELDSKYPLATDYSVWDGSVTAIEREPDVVVDLDKPKFVAFNGGGYD